MIRALTITALLLGTLPAAADPAPPSPPPAGQPTPDKMAQAKTLYNEGITHYNLGEFDQAIDAFKKAYELSSAPGLLFNIAQAYRLKNDYQQAIYFYSTYLRIKPDAPNRADVEQRLTEMNDALEKQKKIEHSPPQGVVTPEGEPSTTTTTATTTTPITTTGATGTTTTTTTTTTTPGAQTAGAPAINPPPGGVDRSTGEIDHPGRPLETAGIATAGAGVALLLTGLVFGHFASNAEKDLNQLSTTGGTWTSAQQDRYDAGKRDNTVAIISFVAGGAAVVTGAALWFLGHSKESHASVAIVPTKGGTSVALGWTF